MKKSTFLTICIIGAFVLAVSAAPASGGVFWPDKWWPSKWGAGDEKGSFNTLTPNKVKSAMKVVKTGKMYRLGMPYEPKMPLFGSRTYALHIPGLPVGGPLGNNNIVWNDEFIVGELGQIGTQFDGPGHVGIRGKDGVDRWYNGAELATMENVYGLKKNGIEKVGPCITRGVLIDMVGLKGRTMNKGEVITLKDVERCIKKAGIAPIGEGDAVIFHTGWGKYWTDPATFNAGCPGIGIEVARYMVKKNVALLAADTWPVDAIPGEDPNGAFDIHNYSQTVNGLWYLENLSHKTMTEMVKDGTYEFLFVFVPVPFVGGTGSPGDAIAIK
jgi:kynurenine formamidase